MKSIIKQFSTAFSAITICLTTIAHAAPADEHAQVGINLAGPKYWTNELPWEDVFKVSQPLFFQDVTNPNWGVGTASPKNADGYPLSLQPNHEARSLWNLPAGFEGGQYVMLYDGTGQVRVQWSAHEVANTTGRIVMNLDAGPGQMLTRIVSTNASDPVRNIRLVPLARENAYAAGTPADPWRQDFLQRWGNMTAYRYMDWMATNNSPVVSWSQRTKPSSQTQTDTPGVALEEMINLANRQQRNPWFTIPAHADDDYVRNFAVMVRDNLDPGLQARIEYSNEVWNSIFEQASYAAQQGAAAGLTGSSFDKQLKFYSRRSVQVFQIFEDVFTHGGTNPDGLGRLKRIMASQSANTYVSNLVLSFENAYQHTDALAIAPYFGRTITSTSEADFFKTATPEQLLARQLQDVANALQQAANHKAVADQYGVDLFAYEGGMHYVGAQGFENDAALTAALLALNRSPDMRELYRTYLQGWDELGGKDFMLFSSLTGPSKWGNWGLMETIDQDPATAYKLLGVLDYLNSIPEPAVAVPLTFVVLTLTRHRRGSAGRV